MKKTILSLAVMAAMSSGVVLAASPNVKGGSSNDTRVDVDTPSNHFMFGGGNSGLNFNGSILGFIDIAGGPINGSNSAIDARGNGTIMTPADMGLIGSNKIAQVWRSSAATNGTGDYANFMVNAIRQIDPPFFAPQFGGLVIGQVGETSTGAPADPVDLLPVGAGVYFGEWANSIASPPDHSTDLNMADASHTVWYVGDNAVTTMPGEVDATYGVIGISGTGTAAGGLPDSPNLYKGKLDVYYSSIAGTGTIGAGLTNNSISRDVGGVTHTISFAGTTIDSDGTFSNSALSNTIEGRFYNGAEALAGMYTNGTYADAAFGGSKIDGTITP
ncbi:hypothetical protein [Pseudomonas sp. MYb185]|uniref:hypothetical protein n=1 Tax=Pseudomonas sp. MYb185 TaxID=1848729 RepID=UPI0011AFE275|nr:hypothetical protein [Pseudomonas sp. MYb185]